MIDDIGTGRDVVAKEVRNVAERAKGDRHGDLEPDDPMNLEVVRPLHLSHMPDYPESARKVWKIITPPSGDYVFVQLKRPPCPCALKGPHGFCVPVQSEEDHDDARRGANRVQQRRQVVPNVFLESGRVPAHVVVFKLPVVGDGDGRAHVEDEQHVGQVAKSHAAQVDVDDRLELVLVVEDDDAEDVSDESDGGDHGEDEGEHNYEQGLVMVQCRDKQSG